MAEHALNYFAS